ncbi:hypothetical protein ILYODFUR_036643 [Ilyodon furcidens]|uniref:Uncharacterized protein n=1 Tax=Ilyodon furcidens TaxID=33524 RepID=A0ABV0UBE1_9TELE
MHGRTDPSPLTLAACLPLSLHPISCRSTYKIKQSFGFLAKLFIPFECFHVSRLRCDVIGRHKVVNSLEVEEKPGMVLKVFTKENLCGLLLFLVTGVTMGCLSD